MIIIGNRLLSKAFGMYRFFSKECSYNGKVCVCELNVIRSTELERGDIDECCQVRQADVPTAVSLYEASLGDPAVFVVIVFLR